MQRLKTALEALDEIISELEDRVDASVDNRRADIKKQSELVKMSQSREANVFAAAQKVASRLDQTINNIERVLRN